MLALLCAFALGGCAATASSDPVAAGSGAGAGVTGPASVRATTAATAASAGSASGPSVGTTPGVRSGPASPPAAPSGTGASAARTTPPASETGNGFTRLPDPVGRLMVTTLSGPASGVRMRVWVWLPPQYDDPANARSTFPALMLFPGGSGAGYNTWSGHQYGAQELVAGGAANVAPFVFVMPQMQLSDRLDTECADLPGQPRVGTFLADDVRALVLRAFRVSADRRSWATAGASSGAYCATRLAFSHPDDYAAVVSIDGYFHLETALPGGRDPGVLAGDPDRLAVTRPPALSVLLWVGGAAHLDTQESAQFLALLRPPTTGELRTLPGGRHLTKDFARMMPDVLHWLTDHVVAPRGG